jgi:hypothetical protein
MLSVYCSPCLSDISIQYVKLETTLFHFLENTLSLWDSDSVHNNCNHMSENVQLFFKKRGLFLWADICGRLLIVNCKCILDSFLENLAKRWFRVVDQRYKWITQLMFIPQNYITHVTQWQCMNNCHYLPVYTFKEQYFTLIDRINASG